MKMLFLKITLCLCLFSVKIIVSQTIPSCLNKVQDDYFCESPNYPNAYLKGDCICELSVPEGYQISVSIQELDLDSSTQDNIIMTTGPEDKIYKFSWFLNNDTTNPRNFLIEKTKVSLSFHADKDSDPDKRGFKIHLKQYGEIPTTVESTTENMLPTPIANDSIYHTIYLDVRPKDFQKQEINFKEFMVNITEQFVTKYNIEVIENITQNNIKIQYAKQCLVQWPNSEHCTEIMYAIPVVLNETTYELKSGNLIKMWNFFGVNNVHQLKWQQYELPNNNYSMWLWLGLSLIILIAFLAFLYFTRILSLRINTHIKRRLSDTNQIMANSNRASDASLWPMSSQIVPPLFDHESPYVYYEPDPVPSSVLGSQMQPSTSKTMMNVDDLSDEEILTVPKSSFNSNQKPILKFDVDSISKESAL